MAAKKDTPDAGLPTAPIALTPLAWDEVAIEIVGTTPLIVHRWSEKSKRQMLEKQQGKAKPKKEPKDPDKERYDATYWTAKDVPGFPAAAFKNATVDATRYYEKDMSFVLAQRIIRIHGEGDEQLVAIDGKVTPREDMARISGTTADLRYRNQIWPWKATLLVKWMSAVLPLESLVALVNAGGTGGVGEMRPSAPKNRGGTFGCYEVKR